MLLGQASINGDFVSIRVKLSQSVPGVPQLIVMSQMKLPGLPQMRQQVVIIALEKPLMKTQGSTLPVAWNVSFFLLSQLLVAVMFIDANSYPSNSTSTMYCNDNVQTRPTGCVKTTWITSFYSFDDRGCFSILVLSPIRLSLYLMVLIDRAQKLLSTLGTIIPAWKGDDVMSSCPVRPIQAEWVSAESTNKIPITPSCILQQRLECTNHRLPGECILP